MKRIKFSYLLIIMALLVSFPLNVSAAETQTPCLEITINGFTALTSDGVSKKISQPLLVFDKAYIDLNEFCGLMGIAATYIEAEIGYFQIKHKDCLPVDITLINTFDDLKLPYKFFVKGKNIYASLRELCNFAQVYITWDNECVTLSRDKNITTSHKQKVGKISLQNANDYVYQNYSYPLEHVVYPYCEYSYDYMMGDSLRLRNMHPSLIQTESIGKSVEGRDLLLIKFGKGDKKIFVCGTHHAREYIATTYLMYAIDQYAYMYEIGMNLWNFDIKQILDNVTFYIVPMVNPDGVNLVQNGINSVKDVDYISSMPIVEGKQYGYEAWKANVHGVDLNWNYDFKWNVKRNKNGPASTSFNGDYPNSEPEAQAMANCLWSQPFDAFLSFHTQGQVFYWSDDATHKTGIDNLVWQDTGFVQVHDSSPSPYGGSFFDYVHGNFKKPTMTVELCKYVGNYPYPNQDFDSVWAPAKNILLIFGKEMLTKR